ncbi:MAG: alpha/beta hydrolase, partial [Candidatus Sulfotelmatobacter sp.]
LLIPDLPGYGRNQGAGVISLPAAVDHVRAEILAAGFDSAHIVGHSVGGAVAVLLAHRYPELVRSVIDVEGNFTLKDAFWSGKMAGMSAAEAEAMIESYRADPGAWLAGSGIEPTAERIAIASQGLGAQPASTVQAMARSVVEITANPRYLDDVRQVLDRGTAFHLVAGERSRHGWDVPAFVSARASSMTIQPSVGHLMMLENAPDFFGIVSGLLPVA